MSLEFWALYTDVCPDWSSALGARGVAGALGVPTACQSRQRAFAGTSTLKDSPEWSGEDSAGFCTGSRLPPGCCCSGVLLVSSLSGEMLLPWSAILDHVRRPVSLGFFFIFFIHRTLDTCAWNRGLGRIYDAGGLFRTVRMQTVPA